MRAEEPGPTSSEQGGQPAGGWDLGASRRFVALAAARGASQVLGIVWFLLAVRRLDESTFGDLAAGLAFFAVFSGIGDAGTTRTVVRHVATNHDLVWSAYWRALPLRIMTGLTVGALTTAAVAVAPVPVPAQVVLLAGLLATVSGATELAFASRRAIGAIWVEVGLLVGERVVFLAAGVVALSAGVGAIGILVLYLVTNLFSAVISGLATWWKRPRHHTQPGPMTDREARLTAYGFALVTISPRLPTILVALLTSPVDLATFSVAQRPVEAIALFALSTATPALPIARNRLSRGLVADADRAVAAVAGVLLLALAPAVAWFLVAPDIPLSLLAGAGRYESAKPVLQILALTTASWVFRGVAELRLLAEERAGLLVRVTLSGAITTVIAGAPFVIAFGSIGAAWAVVAGEAIMTILLARSLPALADRSALRSYFPATGVFVATAVVLAATADHVALQTALLGVAFGVAAITALRLLKHLERR
ncbi:MAG: oligosaccharide flippase family protein [Acidimicrobiales bacterium]|nr:oligosaccharide flippase family protein [Acidimicrobiales bacterium]